MSTHAAVVTTAIHAPLSILQVPTVPPADGEVLVRNEWTASTPLDLHQNDGGLLVTHPQVLGDGIAGTVVEVGSGVKGLNKGDKVFGFAWRQQKEKAFQEFATVPEILLGKAPEGFSLPELVTLPNNVVTAFHAITADLGLPLPWPTPSPAQPTHADSPILIWGGSSSVGQYALQILSHWGYRNLLTTASPHHDALVRSLGARHVFDYKSPTVTEHILSAAAAVSATVSPAAPTSNPPAAAAAAAAAIPFILDCIGSQAHSLAPIARLARPGSRVAVLLPVIIRDSTDADLPEYSMDAAAAAAWQPGVDARGVRTHFYLGNALFRDALQSVIVPTLVAQRVIRPNRQKIVEGETLLLRAQRAMDALRRKEVSGERLVWRVAEMDSEV